MAVSSPVQGTPSTTYQYVATAIDAVTQQESVASPVGIVSDSVDIAVTAGSIQIECQIVQGAGYYKIYKALAQYNVTVPTTGGLFGYIGDAYGGTLTDTNITADFSTV